MQIKLVRQYLNYAPGTVISTFGAGVVRELIRRGVAKPVNPAVVKKKSR